MPTEQLTYFEIAERLSVSPEAARAIVKRHRLPRSRANDGKTLAAIDLQEIRIREAMRGKGMAALGRLVLSKRERVIALEPYDKGLLGTTLRYTKSH